MAAGCQMSKCRARYRLIAEKLRDPGTKAPKGRYRFTPSSSGRDTGCGRPFNSVFDLNRAREKARNGRERKQELLFRFIGPALP